MKRYVVVARMLMYVDSPALPVRRFWTRKGAERYAQLFERLSWRYCQVLADAWVERRKP